MSGVTGASAGQIYQTVSRNETADVTAFAAYDPATKAAIAYFTKVAPTIASPGALLQNYRALSVVLGAFGMSSAINEPALLKQLMTQDPTASSSLAQRLGNPSYLRFAKYMSSWTTSPFASASVVGTITTQYATAQFEQTQGQQATGIQQALYFRRTIGSATTLAQLMSDPTLVKVATTALGLPTQFGELDYDQQVRILTPKLDMTKFQTAGYVDSFVQRFLAQTASTDGSASSPELALFGGGNTGGDSLLGVLYPSGQGTGSMLSSLA